jgi:hypothetical protein
MLWSPSKEVGAVLAPPAEGDMNGSGLTIDGSSVIWASSSSIETAEVAGLMQLFGMAPFLLPPCGLSLEAFSLACYYDSRNSIATKLSILFDSPYALILSLSCSRFSCSAAKTA